MRSVILELFGQCILVIVLLNILGMFGEIVFGKIIERCINQGENNLEKPDYCFKVNTIIIKTYNNMRNINN